MISVDGQKIAKGRIEETAPIRISQKEGLDVDQHTGIPVSLSYDVPFRFKEAAFAKGLQHRGSA